MSSIKKNIEKYKNYNFPLSIEEYKNRLIKDFEEHPDFKNLASSIFSFNTISIDEWVKGIKGKSFRNFEVGYQYDSTPRFYNIEDVKKEDWNWYFFGSNIFEPYSFFEKYEYGSFDEARKGFPSFYYVFNLNFFQRIDNILMATLRDFEKEQNSKTIYTKKISENCFIKLECNYENYTSYSSIDEYVFPTVSLLLNGIEYYFFTQTDVRQMFFLSGTSFMFFYTESNEIILNEKNQIVSAKRKNSEPLIYHDVDSQKYIVTNSYDNLSYYNKYIYLVLELHVHYFRVFEDWIINDIVKI